MTKQIHVHIHGRTAAKDALTASDFNTGLKITAIAKLQDARLPANPSETDIDRSREALQRAKSDIDGLLSTLNALKRQF